jgi:hypothetical protein
MKIEQRFGIIISNDNKYSRINTLMTCAYSLFSLSTRIINSTTKATTTFALLCFVAQLCFSLNLIKNMYP